MTCASFRLQDSYVGLGIEWVDVLGQFGGDGIAAARLLFLAGVASIVGHLINNYGLSRLQASRVVALNGISPMTSVALGVLINHETFGWYHAVGGVLVLVGATGINLLAQRKVATKQ